MKKLIPTFLIFFVASLIFSVAFQNCSPQHVEISSSLNLPLNHPDVTGASGEITEIPLLGDREYLRSVFLQIFSSGSNPEEIPHLGYRFDLETNPHQHLLGRSCNPMESGDAAACNHSSSNTELAMTSQSSSGRSAIRIQTCRRMVENDSIMSWTLSKMSQKDSPPKEALVSEVTAWFYPQLENSENLELQQTLMNLDGEMAKKGESIINRWRLILLALCESPGWEVL